jgi:hypothetical protein
MLGSQQEENEIADQKTILIIAFSKSTELHFGLATKEEKEFAGQTTMLENVCSKDDKVCHEADNEFAIPTDPL